MSLVKGPYEVKYGVDVLAGIEELSLDYEVNTEDYDTVQGRSYTVTTSHRVAVSMTFLETDVASLAVVLPQYFVANGGTLSSGETVNNADGAIDIVPGTCESSPTRTDVVITSCNGHVLRIPDAVTEIESVELDAVRKVVVRFRGEADADVATIQLFAQGAVSIVS